MNWLSRTQVLLSDDAQRHMPTGAEQDNKDTLPYDPVTALVQFALAHHLPIVNAIENICEQSEDVGLLLRCDSDSIELLCLRDKTVLKPDFVAGAQAHRRHFGGGKSQHIAKAVGLNKTKNISVLDLTAGLAKDAFVLAGLGCDIVMLEQHPVLVLLLQDALQRARQAGQQDATLLGILERMNLLAGNSLTYLQQQTKNREQARVEPQVVYLDPMFPERQKSAAVKKDMVMLQKLMSKPTSTDESHAAALLEAAFALQPHRIVVKRPKLAPHLGDKKPSYTVDGKSGRFDIYSLSSLG